MRGFFITLEGPEGSGKSTHTPLVADALRTRLRRPVLTVREPGGTPVSEVLRQVLLSERSGALDPWTELFIVLAARAQLVRTVIRPALSRGDIVISDRFSDATVAYQAYGGGLPLTDVRRLCRLASGGLSPDLTILLWVSPHQGLARAKVSNRMEKKGLTYHRRVLEGYRRIAQQETRRVRLVPVRSSVAATQAVIQEFIWKRLKIKT